MNKKRMFLVSNMYPSKEFMRYGIFVKKFEEAVIGNYAIKKIVMQRCTNKILRILSYMKLYFHILTLLFVAKKRDLIYVHFPLHIAPVLWIVFLFKKNIVLNFHGSDLIFDSLYKRLLESFLRIIVKKTEIVVPSNYYKDKIIRLYDLESNKVFVYPSGGINTKLFCPKRESTGNTFVLGYVSYFVESKGWRIFLDTIYNILSKNSIYNIEVIMIGDGADKNKIIDYLGSLKLKSQIYSNINQNELAVKYNEFDLFVFPTYREAESLGLVGLEAMACGIPIVAGEVGGPIGYVKEGVNGYLFKKKDIQDLENKIMLYYTLSLEEKEKMKINAVKTSKLFDSEVVNKELIEYLNKLGVA